MFAVENKTPPSRKGGFVRMNVFYLQIIINGKKSRAAPEALLGAHPRSHMTQAKKNKILHIHDVGYYSERIRENVAYYLDNVRFLIRNRG